MGFRFFLFKKILWSTTDDAIHLYSLFTTIPAEEKFHWVGTDPDSHLKPFVMGKSLIQPFFSHSFIFMKRHTISYFKSTSIHIINTYLVSILTVSTD